MHPLLSPEHLILSVGLLGLFIIIFAESGIIVGFFLPGDSLLFTAGFLASRGHLNIFILVIGSFFAAVLGDSVGYWFGKKIGPELFKKEHSFFFNKKHIQSSRKFFEKNGRKTVVLARFMPVVRTFTPIIAGVAEMEYTTFLSFNIIGGFIWTAGLCLLGFFLGKNIPNVDHYLLPIIVLIIIISFIPSIVHFSRGQNKNK